MKQSREKLKTQGLVIKENNISDDGKILTILTSDFGVIRAFSSGSRNIKSKKFSASTLLSYSDFSIIKSGDTYRIYEASLKNSFFEIGADISVLALSEYFCELCLYLVPEGENSEKYLRLILNSLYFLATGKKDIHLIKAVTELKLLIFSGYMPDIVACAECKKFDSDIMYLSLSDGAIVCDSCYKGDNLIPLNRTVLSALRHIAYSEFKDIYSFSIPEADAKYLSDITEKYLIHHCEKKFKTLDFFKSIDI